MVNQNHKFVIKHFLDALTGGMAEAEGNKVLADQLRAQTKLRLVTMSEEEMQEYARFVACPPERPFETVYLELKSEVEKLKPKWF